ncbi:MAG TPA: hypothetical protein VH328_05890, partial [Burkholderiaceae bacterium]|nr:hypothetical protein [Burkholderiaceae bacterium]
LFAALPFLAVGSVFAVALGHHLGEPARAARAFEARLRVAGAGAAVDSTDFVSISRAPCARGCVAYDVRVDAAGHVGFTGHVPACGMFPAPSTVDPGLARRLIAAAGESGVLAMPEPALRVAADGASTTLVVRHASLGRRIVFGNRLDAPLPAAIAQAVDALTNDAQWLARIDAQGRAGCTANAAQVRPAS